MGFSSNGQRLEIMKNMHKCRLDMGQVSLFLLPVSGTVHPQRWLGMSLTYLAGGCSGPQEGTSCAGLL